MEHSDAWVGHILKSPIKSESEESDETEISTGNSE